MAQQTIKEELEETLMKELISKFEPKLKKYVGPMSNKLKSFLKDKNKSLHIKLANDDISRKNSFFSLGFFKCNSSL